MGGYTQVLRNLGDDAMANLFEVVIPPYAGADFVNSLKFRIQSITIPGTGVDVYQIHYKTQVIDKTASKINTTREFSITFRADKYMVHYKALKAWKNSVGNTYTGAIGNSETYGVPITVNLTDSDDNYTGTYWVFENARIKSIGDISLDYSEGNPINITATFSFDALLEV